MVYSFLIRTESGEKQFYMTAENHQKLYRRILSTYGISKDDVEILEEYEEDGWGIKLKKSYIDPNSKVDPELMKIANKLFKEAGRKDEPHKTEYFKKHKYSKVFDIESSKDLVPIIEKYKKVKVYWSLGDKRGQHNYYVFAKC